jgi:hypothetical protein
MINEHKGVHKSYGVSWTDILELNDADEMAWRSTIMLLGICGLFCVACSLVIFDIIPK